MKDIIVTLISIGIPSAVTLITSVLDRRFARQSDARQVILQMILEDRFYWNSEHKLPLNYQLIHEQYAKYHAAGGNHEVDIKLKEYEEWYTGIQEKLKNDMV